MYRISKWILQNRLNSQWGTLNTASALEIELWMVLAGSSCQWSEVVGLRAGSNASRRPHPWRRRERGRERGMLLLLLEAFTAPHSLRTSPAKHMTSTLCLRLHMCVFACQRGTESIMERKSESESWEREKKGIYHQSSADRDVFHCGKDRKNH